MNTDRDRYRKATLVLLGVSFLFAHLLLQLLPDVFESWNSQLFDRLLQFRSSTPRFQPIYDETVVHVDTDNATLRDLGEFYLTRAHFARGVQNLARMGVAAQVYDFIFAAPQEKSSDQTLIEATAAAPNVYFGMAFALTDDSGAPEAASAGANPAVHQFLEKTSWRLPVEGGVAADTAVRTGTNPLITFPELASVSKGLGSLNIDADADGVFRRFPLLVRYGNAFYPSLPLRVICDYLGVTPDRVALDPGRSVTLRGARRPGQAAGDIVIPIDRHGYFRINFAGSWNRMTHYSFSRIYRASEDRDEMETFSGKLAGRIVVVSDVSANSRDIGPVPPDPKFPLSGLMANVMNNVLSRDFLRELTSLEKLAVEIVLLACVFWFALGLRPILFSMSLAGLILSYAAVAVLSFLYFHVMFPIIGPVVLLMLALILNVAYRYIVEERDKNILRRTLNAHFSPKVVERIILNPQLIASDRKELTIMFSDVAGFTKRSSTMAPDQIRKMLNEYFEAMTDIVFRYEGTVDKFMGDGLMVFFGDPEPQPDHAERCVRMAVDMQKKIREIGESWPRHGDQPLQIRIGINTGVVVVGNIGSARRLSYTVLGSEVNLAQRLESSAPVGGILISSRTHGLLNGAVPTRPAGQFKVKGFDEPVDGYEVIID